MKSKQLSYEGVNINIEGAEKSPIVSIETNNADVYVNGMLVWQKFEEEYKYIPPVLREYFHKNNPYMDNDTNEEKVLVEFDVCDESVLFLVPYNINSPISARISLVNHMDELESDYIRNMKNIDEATADMIVLELRSIWNELENAIKEANFKLVFSHSMSELFYAWWDIVFPLNNWNEDKFSEVMEIVSRFNNELNKYNDEYSFG